MKSIKMFGLAALAALMAMAFVGASSAMAEGNTSLCTVDGATCASPITHVHETSVGKGKLLVAGIPTVECTVLFLGDALAGLANPLIIHGNFTYTACKNFCSVNEENGPARILLLRLSTELADATVEVLVHFSCPFINCYYDGLSLEGHGLGALTSASANGNVTLTGQEMNKEIVSDISCPPEAFLDLTTTPLVKTYISS